MASKFPDIGQGAAISFSTGFCARITNVDIGELTRAVVQTSHMGTTGGHTKMPGDLYDPGDVSVGLQFDTGTAPPILGTEETVTITFPDGETWAGQGFMRSFKVGVPMEDLMTADAVIAISGSWTF
jgi:hypothetical protein